MRKNKLKKIRLGQNLTQQEIADYCRIALRTYQRIENGERKGDISVWRLLAEFFNTTIDDLLELETDL